MPPALVQVQSRTVGLFLRGDVPEVRVKAFWLSGRAAVDMVEPISMIFLFGFCTVLLSSFPFGSAFSALAASFVLSIAFAPVLVPLILSLRGLRGTS